MADKKISELTAITGSNTAATDVFVVVDTSTGQTKKITREELNNAIEQDVLSSIDIDTINGDFTVNGDINLGDNDKAIFGAGSDLQIYHDGSNSFIHDNGSGRLYLKANDGVLIQGNNNETLGRFIQDGAVQLYFNGSQKLATTSTGIDITGNINLGDDNKAIFGAGSDLEIYHNGNNSFIEDKGTGNLYVRAANNIYFQGTDENEALATFQQNGFVKLYYNNSEKLATTSTGIDVTGTVTADSGAFNGLIKTTDGLFQADKLNQRFRQYAVASVSGNQTFLLGKIQVDGSINGGVTGVVKAAYDPGDSITNVNIHFAFSQRDGTAKGQWWYEHTDDDAGTDVVSVKLIDDGSNNYYVWLDVGDFVQCFIETAWRQVDTNEITDSGNLTASTITSGTTLFDTANNPTSEHHIGKLYAHDDIDVTGTVTADGLTVEDIGGSVAQLKRTSAQYFDFNMDASSNNIDAHVGSNGKDVNLFIKGNYDGDLNLGTRDTTRLKIADNGDISFYEDTGTTAKLFWDASAERLGIGTTLPSANLHISDPNPAIRLEENDQTSHFGIIQVNSDALRIRARANTARGGIRFEGQNDINTVEYARFNNQGYLGIGTTSPVRALHVNGGTLDAVALFESSDSKSGIIFKDSTTTAANGVGIFAQGDNATIYTDDTERMRIASSGQVGLGTSSPSYDLHIKSINTDNNGVFIQSSGSNNYGIYMKSAFAGTMGTVGALNQSDGTRTGASMNFVDFGRGIAFNTNSGASNAERMRVDSDGNLLVGTTDKFPQTLTSDGGFCYVPSSSLRIARESNGVGQPVVDLNNTGSDDEIIRFRKDGATVGTIGTAIGNAYFAGSSTGITFGSANVYPTNASGTKSSGTLTLGSSSNRFKDLHLSGTANAVTINTDGPTGTGNGIVMAASGWPYKGRIGMNGTSGGKQYWTANYNLNTSSVDSASYYSTYIENSAQNGIIAFGTSSAVNTAPSERARLDSSGNLLVGTTGIPNGTSVYGFGVVDGGGSNLKQIRIASSTATSVSVARFYNSNGNVGSIQTSGSSTSYVTSSDHRLKENVTGITDGIERVKQLNPSRFNFIADADTTVDGFIAHEAATVVPEAVTGEKDAVDEDGNPDYQGIDQAKLVPLLTAALQEAITKIEDLEARVATLEGN
jgi:hypothetical protein